MSEKEEIILKLEVNLAKADNVIRVNSYSYDSYDGKVIMDNKVIIDNQIAIMQALIYLMKEKP